MDFTPAESQQAVAALAAEVLAAPDPWQELARAGLLDMSSLGVLDLAMLLTETGRRVPSMQALATLMTGALPLARWGHPGLLPAVASGELILTAALRELSATAVTGGRITGTRIGVPYAGQARLILVPAASGVALVDPRHATLIRTPSSTGEPEYTVRMDQAPVEELLAGPIASWTWISWPWPGRARWPTGRWPGRWP